MGVPAQKSVAPAMDGHEEGPESARSGPRDGIPMPTPARTMLAP